MEITPFVSQAPGSVPSPVQTANERRGNDYIYYISIVRELAERDWPPETPTNSKARTYERARIVPIALGALPYLLTDDTRLVLILDYVLIAFGLAIPAYLISLLVTGRAGLAAALTLLSLGYAVVWSDLPFRIDVMHLRWPGFYRELARSLSLLMDPPDKGEMGQHFRFVQPALSIPFGLAFLWLVLKLRSIGSNRGRVAWGVITVATGLLLFFTYTPVTVVGYFFLICAAGAALLSGERQNFAAYLAAGISIILLLGLLGIPQFLVGEMSDNALLSRLFLTAGTFNWSPNTDQILAAASNKYVLSAFVISPIIFLRGLRFYALVLIGMAILLTVAQIFISDRNLATRMGPRAADLQWILLYVSVAAAAVSGIAGTTRLSGAARHAGIAAAAVLILPLILGQSRAVYATSGESAYGIPRDYYETLEYLRTTYPEDTIVATLDWRFIQLAIMFTDLDPAVSDIALSSRPPEVEMSRLIGLYKAFGVSKEVFLADARRSVENAEKMVEPVARARRTGDAAPYRQRPYITWPEFRSAAIAQYVLYYRSLPDYAGIPLRGEDGGLSDGVIERLSAEWDAAPDCAPWILSEVDLVLWDSSSSPPLDWRCQAGLVPVQRHGALSLYVLNNPAAADGD